MKKTEVRNMAFTALIIAFIVIAIMLFKIPIPFTQGYVHLGDGIIFSGLLLLGMRYGAVAAGIGAGLGDLLSGYAVWAPWSFVIKVGMVIIAGMVLKQFRKKNNWTKAIAMSIGGIFMIAGYYVAEGIMYGNYAAPLVSIPWNVGQVAVGIVIALIVNKSIPSLK